MYTLQWLHVLPNESEWRAIDIKHGPFPGNVIAHLSFALFVGTPFFILLVLMPSTLITVAYGSFRFKSMGYIIPATILVCSQYCGLFLVSSKIGWLMG